MPPPTPTEVEAVECLRREHSAEAFRGLFRCFSPRLVEYFRSRGCDSAVADDLTQDVMLAVFREIRQLRTGESFRPWLYKIAQNCLWQHLRSERRRESMDRCTSWRPAAENIDPMSRLLVGECLRALQPAERAVLILRYVAGLEYHEIAATLREPIGTVQWRVFQSKKKLAERLGLRSAWTGIQHANRTMATA